MFMHNKIVYVYTSIDVICTFSCIKKKHNIPSLGVAEGQFWIAELDVQVMLDLVCELSRRHRTDLIPATTSICTTFIVDSCSNDLCIFFPNSNKRITSLLTKFIVSIFLSSANDDENYNSRFYMVWRKVSPIYLAKFFFYWVEYWCGGGKYCAKQ